MKFSQKKRATQQAVSSFASEILRGSAKVVPSVLKNRAHEVAVLWHRKDKQYGLPWRVANGLAALLIMVSIAMPVVSQMQKGKWYQLSSATLDLVGKSNTALASKLTYNQQTQVYEFNKQAVKEFNPADALTKQVGGASKDSKSLYALDVAQDIKKGVTYHDVNSQLSFKLLPQFGSLPGKSEQGRIVFPLNGGTQAVYTLKNNGLKEDIVVSKNKKDTLNFAYKLQLPKTLEARMIPDGNGAVGIYSGDPTLFSNMSYGSDKDRAAVEKAREKSAKTNLVFGIPAPVITTKDSKPTTATAHFELKGDDLTVVAQHLQTLTAPYSIDPSVVVTSTSDFASGNNESNIDFPTDQINRGGLTGGSVGAWGSAGGNLTTPRYAAGATVYNSFIYVLGGVAGGTGSTGSVEYAKINNNGTLSTNTCGTAVTWCSGGTATASRSSSAVSYNGYLYSFTGGSGAGGTLGNAVDYAKINTDGSVGTWNSANTGAAYPARYGQAAAVSNGYMYVLGGCIALSGAQNCPTIDNTVYKAAISANGTLGAWVSANTGAAFTARFNFSTVVYNGYMYALGGCTAMTGIGNCATFGNDTWYAKINSDGGLGGWSNTNMPAFTTGRSGAPATVYDGYLYIFQGCSSGDNGYCTSGGTMINDVQYAPIYANGTIGTWATTNTLAAVRADATAVVSNGYQYVMGGCTNNICAAGNGLQADTQYAKIDTPGTIAPYKTTNSFDTAGNERSSHMTIASNGYMYVLGGNMAAGGTANTVRSAPINADGSLGTWVANTAFPDGRQDSAVVAYGNSIYLVGGSNLTAGAGSGACKQNQTQYYCQEVSRATIDPATGTLTWSGVYQYSAQGRSSLAAVVNNGYLYAIGGRFNNNSSETNEVDVAKINPDGTLGAFTTTQPMQIARSLNVNAYAWGGRIYALGGSGGSSAVTSTEFATPNSDGTIPASGTGSWAYTGGTNPTTAYNAQTVGWNGYMYRTGGRTAGGTGSTTTQIAKINGDGTITNWTNSSQNFVGVRFSHGSAAYNGYLYILGGCNNSAGCNSTFNSVLRDVQYAQINNGGSGVTGAWVDQGATGAGRIQLAGAAYNDFLYTVGGCTGNTSAGAMACTNLGRQGDVRYAAIGNDGTVGSWASAGASLATARNGLTAVASNGYLYILGGCSVGSNGDCTTFQNDVQYALICTGSNSGVGGCGATAGTIGSWSTANSFSTGRYGQSSAVYSGYLYVLGGCSATSGGSCVSFQSDVQKALICTGNNSGIGGCGTTAGAVGTWASAGSDFTTGRLYQSAVIYSGYLYVLGGCSAMATSKTCTTMQSDVQYRQLDPSTGGLTGSWQYTTSFGPPSFGATAAAYNGNLYLVGGCTAEQATGGNCLTTIDSNIHASFTSNGGIGDWNMSPTHLSSPRAMHALVLSKGYLVLLNGMAQSNMFITTASTAPMLAQPRKAIYSKLIDLGIQSNVRSITYNNSQVGSATSVAYAAVLSGSAAYTATGNADTIPGTRCTGLNNVRYLFIRATIDDSNVAVFPDTQQGNITDLTVTYEPIRPPQNRLRLGHTLQNGALSDLDICKLNAL